MLLIKNNTDAIITKYVTILFDFKLIPKKTIQFIIKFTTNTVENA